MPQPHSGKSTAGKSTAGKSTAGKSTAGKSTAGKSTAGKPPRRPFQFSLGGLLLITAMFSVLAAAFGAMWRAHRDAALNLGFSGLMAVAAPLAVLMAVSLLYSAVEWLKRRR